MARFAKSVLRGLLVPDDRLAFWDAQSGEYDGGGTRLGVLPSAGPRAGVPAPTAGTDSKLVLRATGDQTEGVTVAVRATLGGMAEPGGAGVVYKRTTDTDWFGADGPLVLTGWEPVSWYAAGGTSSRSRPCVATLSDDTVVEVCQVGVTGGAMSVRAVVRDTAGTWTETTIYSLGTQDQNTNPAVCIAPGDRVLCFHWEEDTAEDLATIRMWWSTDLTGSWQIGARHVLPARWSTEAASTGYYLGRLRAACKDGQILLLANVRTRDTAVAGAHEILVQYASSDGGHSFVEVCRTDVTRTTPKEGTAYFDIAVAGGHFVVAYVDIDSTDLGPTAVRLGSAYQPILGVEAVNVDSIVGLPWGTLDGGNDYFTDGDIVLAANEAGCLYCLGRLVGASSIWVAWRSTDGGETWAVMGDSFGISGTVFNTFDAGSYPKDAAGTWQRGRLVFLHGFASTPSTYGGGSLCAAYLGGHTTVCMPRRRATADDEVDQVGWRTMWLPFDLPSDMGWARVVTGGTGESLATGRLVLTLGSGDGIYYSRNPSGSMSGGLIASASVLVAGGTATLEVRTADGTNGYEARIEVTSTQVKLYDANGSTLIGSAATHGGGEVQVLIGIENAAVTAWWRDWSTGEERAWTHLGTSSALATYGVTYATHRVMWGTGTTLTTRTHTWRPVLFATDEGGGIDVGLSAAPSNPSALLSIGLSTLPSWLCEGIRVFGVRGPAQLGDEWTISVEHSHEPEDLLPTVEPSPRRPWRSAARTALNASTASLRIAFRLNGEDTLPGNDLWAFWLDGLNCGGIQVQARYGGAWTTLTTTPTHTFSAQRLGDTLRPTTSSSLGGKIRRGEWDGAGVTFLSGGGLSVVDYVGKVLRNTEGITNTNGITSRRAIFTLEDEDGTLSGEASTPTVVMWPRRVLVVVHASGYAAALEAIRLIVPVATGTGTPGVPVDGYFEIGKLAFGHVVAFGHDYSWGWAKQLEPNVAIDEFEDGTRRARVLGPARQVVEMGWQGGVDVTGWRSVDAPDYLTGSANASAEPVAFRQDLPLLLMDLVDQLDGAASPVVYIPAITYDSSATSSGDLEVLTSNWGGESVYGRIVSAVRHEHVIGDELATELLRVTALTIEEEK